LLIVHLASGVEVDQLAVAAWVQSEGLHVNFGRARVHGR
jgi:hypothetical protein